MTVKRSQLSEDLSISLSGLAFCFYFSEVGPFTCKALHIFYCFLLALPVGFCIRTLACKIEAFFFLTWCGHPGERLLEGKDIRLVRFYSGGLAKSYLQLDLCRSCSAGELFHYARSFVLKRDRSLHVFTCLYYFIRDVLTVSIPCCLLLLAIHLTDLSYYLYLPVLLLLWLAGKYVAYLWAREVLRLYLKDKMPLA